MRDKLLLWVLIADLAGSLAFVAAMAFQLFSQEPVTLNNLLFLAVFTFIVFSVSLPLLGMFAYAAWVGHRTILVHKWTATIIGIGVAFAYALGLLAMIGSDLKASIPFVAVAAIVGALTFWFLIAAEESRSRS